MIYDTVIANLEKSHAFQPKHDVDPEAIKAFMARITGTAAPLNDEEKAEFKTALDNLSTELKAELSKKQMQARKKPLSTFNDGMDVFKMNTGIVDFPMKLMQRGKEVTDFDGLQAKLEEHGILILELHFADGDVFELVARHRKGDADFISFVHKV